MLPHVSSVSSTEVCLDSRLVKLWMIGSKSQTVTTTEIVFGMGQSEYIQITVRPLIPLIFSFASVNPVTFGYLLSVILELFFLSYHVFQCERTICTNFSPIFPVPAAHLRINRLLSHGCSPVESHVILHQLFFDWSRSLVLILFVQDVAMLIHADDRLPQTSVLCIGQSHFASKYGVSWLLIRPVINLDLHCSDKTNTPCENFRHRFLWTMWSF